MPMSCSSTGAATTWATSSAEAPEYVMLTLMVGGDTSGYSEMGILFRQMKPASIIRMEMTKANLGR